MTKNTWKWRSAAAAKDLLSAFAGQEVEAVEATPVAVLQRSQPNGFNSCKVSRSKHRLSPRRWQSLLALQGLLSPQWPGQGTKTASPGPSRLEMAMPGLTTTATAKNHQEHHARPRPTLAPPPIHCCQRTRLIRAVHADLIAWQSKLLASLLRQAAWIHCLVKVYFQCSL